MPAGIDSRSARSVSAGIRLLFRVSHLPA